MKIEVKIIKRKSSTEKDKTKAFATVTLDEKLVLNNIKIIEGKNGLFVAYPQTKGKDKDGHEKWYDVFFPVTKEFYAEMQEVILKAYDEQK